MLARPRGVVACRPVRDPIEGAVRVGGGVMMTFFQVLAAIVAAVVVLAWLARWWFRRWLRRKVGQAMSAAALLDPRASLPARIALRPAAQDELPEALRAAWANWHGLGFRPLGDFAVEALDDVIVRGAVLAEARLGLALRAPAGDDGAGATYVLFALTEGNRLIARSSDADDAPMETAGVQWRVDAGAAPQDAVAALSAEVRGLALQAIDPALFKVVYERAWAARRDATLASPPSRAAFEARVAARGAAAPVDAVERAFAMTLAQWDAQVTEAALDQFRRSSRIDAVRWESLRDAVHVVHRHTHDDTVRALLVDDDADGLLADQLVAQGLHGPALYAALAARLPAARRRERLGEVTRPLPAAIYGPTAQPANAPARLREFSYAAEDAGGRTVHGAVFADGSGDAKRQLEAMGLAHPRIVIEPVDLGPPEPYMLEPEFLASKARAAQRSLWASLGFALLGNAWIWAPPALWAAWSLWQGPPYGWGDWTSFVLAAIAAVVVGWFILPMVLYNELQRARTHGRWTQARVCIALLRVFNAGSALSPDTLLAESLKVQAGSGGLDGALARWAQREPDLSREQYLQTRVAIFDAAGDHAGMIAAQRALHALDPAAELPAVDLAMGLARFGDTKDLEEAEGLLAAIRVQDLSELAIAGHLFARGVAAWRRDQPAAASHHLQQAQRQLAQFQHVPLVHGMLAEIGGYHALALRAAGDATAAQALWASVAPLLRVHHSTRGLRQAWGEAVV
jgi:hypothetical protein